MCGARVIDEDFSSGRFNIHRYDTTVPGGEPFTLTLRRSGGVYQPMLLVTEADGELAFAGDVVTLSPDVAVWDATASDEEVSVTLQLSATRMLSLWVTDAGVAAGAFGGAQRLSDVRRS